jgi:hypothetical protein
VNGDARVAAALVTDASAFAFTVSALVATVPFAIASMAMLFSVLTLFLVLTRPRWRTPLRIVASVVLVAVVTLIAARVLYVVSFLVLLVAFFMVAIWIGDFLDEFPAKEIADDPNARRNLGIVAGLVILGQVVTIFVNHSPWLPAENVYVSGSPIAAYVIADDGSWTKLLTERTRTILIVRSQEITARALCRTPDSYRSAAIEFEEAILGRPDLLPPCVLQ